MNEDTGRAEEMVYEERKKERKGRDSVDGATARTEKIEGGVRRGCRGQQQQQRRSILLRSSRILGSVCRVAWPIVCKGSRSSSKEPAEEEEEGSEAN